MKNKALNTDSDIARELMKYTGKIAWPTIILFLISFTFYTGMTILGIYDIIPLWIVCISNTLMAYLLFTPLHEAGHQNIKGKKRKLKFLEDSIGWLSATTLMAPYPLVRYIHNLHHKNTNHPSEDPDYWVASKNYLLLFVKCISIYYDYIFHYIRNTPSLWKVKKTRVEYIQSMLFIILFNVILIYWGANFGWLYPILIVLIPGYLSLGILAFAFDWLPHHPHAVQGKYLDTRIILKPGLSILLVSQNMHLIHHLYAGIPFYNYGKALQVMKEHLTEKGANIQD